MKKIVNTTHIEGRIFEIDLKDLVSAKEVPYIGGSISIATDDAGLNVIKVRFGYVTEKTSKGNVNRTYAVLRNFIDNGVKTWTEHGKDEATMVKLDSAIGLSEYYRNENGEDKLISFKENSGGFLHVIQELDADQSKRDTFKCDMVITGYNHIEEDPDTGATEKLVIKGCTFDFGGRLLPVDFSVTNPNGIKYVLDKLDVGPGLDPVFTQVWGRQLNETIETKVVTENAFGEDMVEIKKRSRRDWLITGMSVSPYDWDAEESILASELKEKMEQRNIDLAALLQGQKEREAKKAAGNNAFTVNPNKGTDFNF